MKQTIIKSFFCLFFLTLIISCVKEKNLYNGEEEEEPAEVYTPYLYPYGNEAQNITAEIIIETNDEINANELITYIPHLKYNKTWLFMLTQDDCKHAAYSCTWAAINGKPLSNQYYYDAAQLYNKDLPPDVYSLGKTLGCTDGTGKEVRFHFTTTLAPEWSWMDAVTEVKKGFTKNHYRFYMKEGLIWDNVKELLNYGNGIAFHDVNTDDINNSEIIRKHFEMSQEKILDKLSGRGCKMLAEPNGNKSYIDAAMNYKPIQTITAQSDATSIQPFLVENDLNKVVINRVFYDNPDMLKEEIKKQLAIEKNNRYAVTLGVHNTNKPWVDFLLWLNDSYGKDGDDSVWFPCQEEYYEYNFYRIHGSVKTEQIETNKLKLTVNFPSESYFYYPSITVNIGGLSEKQIVSISSNDAVTGFSFGNYEKGIMLNIDCRKSLLQHATHFVEQYEKDKSNTSNKTDAIYFVNMLKDSDSKTKLNKRIK